MAATCTEAESAAIPVMLLDRRQKGRLSAREWLLSKENPVYMSK